MAYSIELYFDPTTETAIRHVWQVIAEANIQSPMYQAGYRPHISLSVYDDKTINIDDLHQSLLAYATTISPFNLVLSHVGIFPTSEGVIFLGTTVTQNLLEIHANFHHTFKRYAAKLRSYYDVANWVPHCTLSLGVSSEEGAKIISICWQELLPIYGYVQEIGIAQVSPIKCHILFICPLGTIEKL